MSSSNENVNASQLLKRMANYPTWGLPALEVEADDVNEVLRCKRFARKEREGEGEAGEHTCAVLRHTALAQCPADWALRS